MAHGSPERSSDARACALERLERLDRRVAQLSFVQASTNGSAEFSLSVDAVARQVADYVSRGRDLLSGRGGASPREDLPTDAESMEGIATDDPFSRSAVQIVADAQTLIAGIDLFVRGPAEDEPLARLATLVQRVAAATTDPPRAGAPPARGPVQAVSVVRGVTADEQDGVPARDSGTGASSDAQDGFAEVSPGEPPVWPDPSGPALHPPDGVERAWWEGRFEELNRRVSTGFSIALIAGLVLMVMVLSPSTLNDLLGRTASDSPWETMWGEEPDGASPSDPTVGPGAAPPWATGVDAVDPRRRGNAPVPSADQVIADLQRQVATLELEVLRLAARVETLEGSAIESLRARVLGGALEASDGAPPTPMPPEGTP
jgi:hypothetical protein